jgi:hypothetical protein
MDIICEFPKESSISNYTGGQFVPTKGFVILGNFHLISALQGQWYLNKLF